MHPRTVRAKLVASGLAPSSVNTHLRIARMLFKAARRDAVIGEDPAQFVAGVRAPAGPVKPPFSLEELRAVLQVADPEWQSLVIFGFYTGQRLGDLARLTFASLDLDKNQFIIRTGKTSRFLAVPLPPPLRRHIESLGCAHQPHKPVHPCAAAVLESQGRTGMLSRQFGELLEQAGLREKRSHQAGSGKRAPQSRLSFHSLRGTATTLLHEAGIPQAVAQALIGHDSAAIHQVYVSVGREALIAGANVYPNILL